MKQALVATLTNLIRQQGYAYLSISDIAEATNLSKSSLYHHFPGGKIEMAQAVLASAYEMLGAQFTACLQNNKSARQQLIAVLNILNEFYDFGKKNCLVDVMSVASTDPIVQAYLDKIIAALIQVFATILKADGLDRKTAAREAITIVSLLQGSLVLARASQDPKYFRQTIKLILQQYCRVIPIEN